MTEGLIEGRKQAPEFERYYKEYIPGYENVELTATASLPGIRESRRITGDYILNLEDYKSRAVFDDEIGRYSYPIDIHPASTAQADQDEFEKFIRSLHYKSGESYGIPYRIFTVKGFKNLLNAGRSVSADRYMQGSIRLMRDVSLPARLRGLPLQQPAKITMIFATSPFVTCRISSRKSEHSCRIVD